MIPHDLDYHALIKESKTSTHECGIFRRFCNIVILVSVVSVPKLPFLNSIPGSLVFSPSKALFGAHVSLVVHWAKAISHSKINSVEDTLIQIPFRQLDLCKRMVIIHRLPKGIFVLLVKFVKYGPMIFVSASANALLCRNRPIRRIIFKVLMRFGLPFYRLSSLPQPMG
jgi:hypothetical protein